MENGRKLPWLALAIIVVIGLCGLGTMFEAQSEAKSIEQPDLIAIDDLAELKALDMPPVVFLHDQHTKAIDEFIVANKLKQTSCSFCHVDANGVLSSKFKRQVNGKNSKDLEKLYHDSCIGCHMDTAKADLATGPVDGECRDCHVMRTPLVNSGVKINFDKSLHAKHVGSALIVNPNAPENCGVCHHGYDPALEKLVWVKGEEDACSLCHKSQPQSLANFDPAVNLDPKATKGKPDKSAAMVLSLKDASHASCIGCHQALNEPMMLKGAGAISMPAGPTTCAGCHTLEAQAKYQVVADPKRLERGQPDITVLMPTNEGTLPVVFNHKFHESVTDSCGVCHHAKIGNCTQCHTLAGSKEGNFVTLPQAMHTPNPKGDQQSCISCHQQVIAADPNCAGCHVAIKPMRNCATCHQAVPGLTDLKKGELDKSSLGKPELQVLGEAAVAEKQLAKPLSVQDIPETVIIGSLSKEYQPSIMPHRKINAALQKGMANSKLAASFHTSSLATCAACHHYSPVSELQNPPPCASCHQADTGFAGTTAYTRPNLKLAYHQQCMSCHESMQVKPVAVDCQGCHAPIETSGKK